MTGLRPRIGAKAEALPRLCDAWLADGRRFGDRLPGSDDAGSVGVWPEDLETDAVVRLAQAVGDDPSWATMAATPPVAQKLHERAQPLPLDREIMRHLRHLQHVCQKPRLHLRVEEERLPVSRARRVPVRAVADLVAHPGDWEHRTLRSIQPARVLARQIEDEWNLYENRVAARLVNHLLTYLAKRLEELQKIEEALATGRDHSDEARTSFWRARRVMTLWADTLTTKTEEELRETMRRLKLAQRDLQVLLGSPLYQQIPRRSSVPLSLKPTNILVNDPHYRKVAALWRAWVKYGHRRHETQQQRAARRQREADAWDRFVLHLTVRGLSDLGWTSRQTGLGWTAERPGFLEVLVSVDSSGVVRLDRGERSLRLLPLCANLTVAEASDLTTQLEAWDALDGEVVAVHVGKPAALVNLDRATGWSQQGHATLFACSPWGIDSEERMARLLSGWINRSAIPAYPAVLRVRALPDPPGDWKWLCYRGEQLLALIPPSEAEIKAARTWAARQARVLDTQARQAKQAKQAPALAPRNAITAFGEFIPRADDQLAGLDKCPVCDAAGLVDPRPGKSPDGSDATWWALCTGCGSEWGLRQCGGCGERYRALSAQVGLDLSVAARAVAGLDWPDKVLGRDVWAQPCSTGVGGHFRCPDCGGCSGGRCGRCEARGSARP